MSAITDFGAASADGAPPAASPPPPAAVLTRRDRGRRVRLPKSPKIIFGLVTLGLFLVLAVIGPWIAPYSPGASVSTTNGVPQPPSAAHWLGTTQLQQDVFSQLLAGGRSMLVVAFLSGALLTEIVCSYPGVGWILLQAVNNRDYPLLQGIFLIITFAVLAANLAADFVYVMLDPRTRQEA